MTNHNAKLPLRNRILLVGDTHANLSWTQFVVDQARKLRVDQILQLGDFGYWPRDAWGRRFLSDIESRLSDCGLTMWFVDGNHEDHASLRSDVREPGLVAISEHVSYVARGTRWTWGDTTWLAVGGATSVDREWRKAGVDWFPEEIMSEEELLAVERGGHADVVVAHEAPSGVRFLSDLYDRETGPGWPQYLLDDADAYRRRLTDLLRRVEPRVWFHGHHHVAYHELLTSDFGCTQVWGLENDGGVLPNCALMVDSGGHVIPWNTVFDEM